jgi:two-component system response regulator YesN
MTQIASGIRDRADEQSESIVQKAQKYMRENYMKEISLDDVSKEVNVSPYYFSKLFKEEVGENFIEYLTKIRIGKAKEMLAKGSESVKEIGLASGYADSNYFSRIFKKQTGMTPSEYRDHLREDGS